MAWNEPGGGNRDPWSSGGGRNNQGPPDLDEVIRKLRQRLEGLFGGGRRGGNGAQGGEGRGPGKPNAKGIGIIIGLVFAGWVLSGIYIVDEGTRGVVTRFGAYQQTAMPGPHWHLPIPSRRSRRSMSRRVAGLPWAIRRSHRSRPGRCSPRRSCSPRMRTS